MLSLVCKLEVRAVYQGLPVPSPRDRDLKVSCNTKHVIAKAIKASNIRPIDGERGEVNRLARK